MASSHPVKAASDSDRDLLLVEGELKFVRWDHQATRRPEISVKLEGEVQLIKKVGEDSWMVKVIKTGETGIIPIRCFTPREIVKWSYSAKNKFEVSVNTDEIIGVLKKDLMWKIVKENGEEGEVPSYCFNLRKKVEWPYSGKITLRAGDMVGVEHDTNEGPESSEIKVRTEDGTTGLVPRYCFYEKCEVLKSYDATGLQDIKVTEEKSVGLADKNHLYFKVYVKDENGEGKIGLVPENCIKSGLKLTASADIEEKEKTLIATEEGPHQEEDKKIVGLGVQ